MPQIPYNPSLGVARPQSRGRVDFSGAANAIGREANAINKTVQMFQGAIGTGMAAVRNEREKEIYADKLGFEARVKDAQSKAAMEIEAIPVGDGVDFDAESAAIIERHYGGLRDYLQDPGNVRHKEAMQDFELRLATAESDGRRKIDEYKFAYERRRSAGRGERMVEVGMKTGDTDLIEKGIFAQHEAGKFTAEQAQTVFEKSVRKMHEAQDADLLLQAENLLAEGDVEGFREKIDAQNLPTAAAKEKMKRERIAKRAYLVAGEALSKMEDAELSELRKFRDDPDAFAPMRGMDEQLHKIPLRRQAAAMIRRVEMEQHKRAQTMLKAAGRGDLETAMRMLEDSGELNNRLGIPAEYRGVMKDQLKAAAAAFERGEQLKAVEKQAESNKDYKALRDAQAAAVFALDAFDLGDNLKAIEKLNVASPVKARLMSEAFGLAAAQQKSREPEKDDFRFVELFPFVAALESPPETEREFSSYEQLYSAFGQSVEVMGPWDGLSSELRDAEKEIAKWHRNNRNASEKEVREMESSIIAPIFQKARRYQLRNQ